GHPYSGDRLHGMVARHVSPAVMALYLGVGMSFPATAQTVERAAEVPALTEGPTVDRDGNVYFTELRAQRIYKLGTDGELSVYRIDGPGQTARCLTMPDVERPNGLQISPDDKTLYIIESGPAPAGPRMIRAFELQPDGTARNGRVLFNFPGRSADGMSVDVQG